MSRSIWFHETFVIIPKNFTNNFIGKAIVYIDGGGNNNDPDHFPKDKPCSGDDKIPCAVELIMKLASDLGVVGIFIRQVPNESVRFYDDHYSNYKNDFPNHPDYCDEREECHDGKKTLKRSEDSIIAYTWGKYVKFSQEERSLYENQQWLLRFPMTKAVKKCVDAASEFIVQKLGTEYEIKDLMVTGKSKRGWTTWTFGAVDKRVRAIAPLVMDILKLNDQMHSHFMNLGGWTFAFQDYWWENNTFYVDTAAMGDMCKHIDPWSYRYRYRDRGITVYNVNAAGDEFFLIDDNYQYFTEMPVNDDNTIFQRYMRNAEHSNWLKDHVY